jgi:hypothetical protein
MVVGRHPNSERRFIEKRIAASLWLRRAERAWQVIGGYEATCRASVETDAVGLQGRPGARSRTAASQTAIIRATSSGFLQTNPPGLIMPGFEIRRHLRFSGTSCALS